YYELALGETLRRHQTKPLAAEVSVDTVATWYRNADPVLALREVVFDETVSAGEAMERVLVDVGWSAPDANASETASAKSLRWLSVRSEERRVGKTRV